MSDQVAVALEGVAVEENLKPGPLLGDNQAANALQHIQERQRFILRMVESGMIKVLYIYRQRKWFQTWLTRACREKEKVMRG